jgi:hypothetical protein
MNSFFCERRAMETGKSRDIAFPRPAPSHPSNRQVNFSVMTSPDITLNRRAVLALGAAAAAVSTVAGATENRVYKRSVLARQARLAVSFSLMFEAGGQPISGAPGSFGPIEKGRAGSSLIS